MKAIINAEVNPITSSRFKGSILIDEGEIVDFGPNIDIPDDAKIIDVKGKTVIPGMIDAHCHVGISEEGEGWEGQDHNEHFEPVTPHLRAIDGINPNDIAMKEAVTAGVTSLGVAPGSANPVGGRFAAIKTSGSLVVDELIIEEPIGMKMATGENPKRNYKEKNQMPSTRMSTAGIIREKLFEAKNYMKRDKEEKERDFKLEALIPVLKGDIPGRIHAHRADDIVSAVRIAEEFGLDVVIEHCTEGHKLADFLAENDIPVVFGPGLAAKSKRENRERTFKTAGILSKKGVKVAIMTDSPVVPIKYLPLMAAYSVREGMDRDNALKAITINAAEICGIDHKVGSIEKGKDADLVVVDGDPLDLKSKIDKVMIEGEEIEMKKENID